MKTFEDKLFTLPLIERPKLPDADIADQRIIAILEEASRQERYAGMTWYQDAHDMCHKWAIDYNIFSHSHVAGIIAALSPQRSWESNLEIAELVLRGETAGQLDHAIASAQAMRSGVHPTVVLYEKGMNNPKVRAFYENMDDPIHSLAVTVDRHVLGIVMDDFRAIQKAGLRITPGENAFLQERFRILAQGLGMRPNQLQAITWVVWKRLRGDPMPIDYSNQLEIDFDSP